MTTGVLPKRRCARAETLFERVDAPRARVRVRRPELPDRVGRGGARALAARRGARRRRRARAPSRVGRHRSARSRRSPSSPAERRRARAHGPTSWSAGSRRSPRGRARSAGEASAATLPFVELVTPWVEAAAARAAAALPALERDARAARLAGLAGRAGAPALLDRRAGVPRPLRARAGAARQPGAYARYLAGELGSGFAAIAEELPGLVRQLAQRSEDWIEATVELVGRLEADRARAGVAVRRGRRSGPGGAPRGRALRSARARPPGGRAPLRVGSRGGVQAAAARARSPLRADLPRARRGRVRARAARGAALDRGTHGWMERVRAADLGTEAAVRAWYRRAGALTALAWLLGGRDLHAENLIAAAEGPVLIDAEMLLSPRQEVRRTRWSRPVWSRIPRPPPVRAPGATPGSTCPTAARCPRTERVWSGARQRRAASSPGAAPPRGRSTTSRAGRPRRSARRSSARSCSTASSARRASSPTAAGCSTVAGAALERAPDARDARAASVRARATRPRSPSRCGRAISPTASRRACCARRCCSRSPREPSAPGALAARRRGAGGARGARPAGLPHRSRRDRARARWRASGSKGLFAVSGWHAVRARLAALDEAEIARQRARFAAALAPRRLPPAEEERRLDRGGGVRRDRARGRAGVRRAVAGSRRCARSRSTAASPGARCSPPAPHRATGDARWRDLALAPRGRARRRDRARCRGGRRRDRGATDGWGSIVWSAVALAELLERPEPLATSRGAAARLGGRAGPRRALGLRPGGGPGGRSARSRSRSPRPIRRPAPRRGPGGRRAAARERRSPPVTRPGPGRRRAALRRSPASPTGRRGDRARPRRARRATGEARFAAGGGPRLRLGADASSIRCAATGRCGSAGARPAASNASFSAPGATARRGGARARRAARRERGRRGARRPRRRARLRRRRGAARGRPPLLRYRRPSGALAAAGRALGDGARARGGRALARRALARAEGAAAGRFRRRGAARSGRSRLLSRLSRARLEPDLVDLGRRRAARVAGLELPSERRRRLRSPP